jgi:hypothetical protein
MAVGLLIGRVWRAWSARRPAGLLFYPFCFMFVLELLRFNYLAAPRFTPIAIALLLALVTLRVDTAGWRPVPQPGGRGMRPYRGRRPAGAQAPSAAPAASPPYSGSVDDPLTTASPRRSSTSSP